ncbi:uncharacterized protein LOC144580413 [Callithrix jacchus]
MFWRKGIIQLGGNGRSHEIEERQKKMEIGGWLLWPYILKLIIELSCLPARENALQNCCGVLSSSQPSRTPESHHPRPNESASPRLAKVLLSRTSRMAPVWLLPWLLSYAVLIQVGKAQQKTAVFNFTSTLLAFF